MARRSVKPRFVPSLAVFEHGVAGRVAVRLQIPSRNRAFHWSNGNGQRDDDQQNSLELDNCVGISSDMFSNCEVTRSGMEVWQIKQQAKTRRSFEQSPTAAKLSRSGC